MCVISRIFFIWVVAHNFSTKPAQYSSKFFTYVTKTRPNNGIIIFDIDIMKKSATINLPLTKPKRNFISGAISVNKSKPNNQNICERVKFEKY